MTTTTEHFGGCPECGRNDGFLNTGPGHWFFCDAHKTKWCEGSNLFSGWRDETEADWQRNADVLAGCREVEPIYPEPTYEQCVTGKCRGRLLVHCLDRVEHRTQLFHELRVSFGRALFRWTCRPSPPIGPHLVINPRREKIPLSWRVCGVVHRASFCHFFGHRLII